jgi:dihydrofolate synthase/folylpolyglutamate synthase
MHTHFRDKKKILVFGVMKDKEYEIMLREIVPEMDTVILTKPNIERALSPQNMQACLNNAIITDNIRNALEKARTAATEKDLILITGSFYTIGEAKTIINEFF